MTTEANKATGSHDRRKAAAQRSPGSAGDAFDNTKACVALEAKGFKLAPLPAGKKFAPPTGWNAKGAAFKWRTSNNIAILTEFYGDGALLVLDVDVKGEVDGADTLARLEAEHGELPRTLIHGTPTGGGHIIYRAANAAQSTAGKLGPGLDVRSASGYIVAPGSVTDKGEYTVKCDAPIADAPQWLVDLCGQPRERQPREEVKPLTGQAAETATRKAIAYLQGEAPGAIEGAAGDRTAYEVACKVRDFGVPEAECVDLMLDHWNDRCAPPWPADDLTAKVINAYRYATGNFAGANPAAVFDVVEQDAPRADAANDEADKPTAKKAGPSFRVRKFSELFNDPEPEWLIHGVMPEQGLGMVYGEPGSGKSFLVLDIAAAIARGQPWGGCKSRQGTVAYVGLEGRQRRRGEAYLQLHGLKRHELDNVRVIERQPFDLLAPHHEYAVALTRDIKAAVSGRVRAVFIDTLNRALRGGDENSSVDMGVGVAALEEVAKALRCIVILVHHSGKDQGRGARGHSSLHGATDVELVVKKESDGSRTVAIAKSKDGEDGLRWRFDLKTVTVGRDAEGEPIGSCVVADLQKLVGSSERGLTEIQAALMEAIKDVTAAKRDDATAAADPLADVPVKLADWRRAYYDLENVRHPEVSDSKLKDRFKDGVAALTKSGRVRDCGRSKYAIVDDRD